MHTTQHEQIEETVISQIILDNLLIPIVVGKACYDLHGKIIDVKISYLNKAYATECNDFMKVGESYHMLQKKLPDDSNWFSVYCSVLETGTTYEAEFFSEVNKKWYQMIVQKCGSDSCSFTLIKTNKDKLTEYTLSQRQVNIARKVLQRKQYKIIADEVFVSTALVKKECKEIYSATGVKSKNEFLLKFS